MKGKETVSFRRWLMVMFSACLALVDPAHYSAAQYDIIS